MSVFQFFIVHKLLRLSLLSHVCTTTVGVVLDIAPIDDTAALQSSNGVSIRILKAVGTAAASILVVYVTPPPRDCRVPLLGAARAMVLLGTVP